MNFYKKSSIKTRLFISQILLLSLSMMSFFVLSYAYVAVKSRKDVSQSINHSSDTASLQTTKLLNQMENTLYYVSQDSRIPQILSSKNIHGTVNEKYSDYLYIINSLPIFQNSCDFPVKLSVYIPPEINPVYYDYYNTFNADDLKNTSYFHILDENDNRFFYYGDPANNSIFIINTIYDINDYNRVVGYIKISVDIPVFGEVLEQASPDKTTSLLYNKHGGLITASSAVNLTADDNSLLSALDEEKNMNSVRLSDNRRFFAVRRGADHSNYSIVMLYPAKYVYITNLIIFLFLLILLCIVSVCAFIISRRVSSSLINSIDSLVGAMKRVSLGEFKTLPLPDESKENETVQITEAYNHMIETIDNLIKYNERYALTLKKYEFDFLQMQIKPHFLYNTLNVIQSLYLDNHADDAVRLISALSKFYKLSLHTQSDFVNLEHEINHILKYIEIENYKYNNAINVKVDVPDELRRCLVPKIILQPLIENAIHHGILEKDSGTGTISINSRRDGEDVLITIADDGIGMNVEQLNNLKNGLGSGIGYANTDRRIKLFFGSEYGLDIESEEGKYTKITIKIKERTEDSDNDCNNDC